MRSRSPGAGGGAASGGPSSSAAGGAGGNTSGAKGSRRRSYSSGSSFSTSSSTSSSSSSSYSSSSSRSSRSSASSRSSSQSKSMNVKRRQGRKPKTTERVKGSHKTAASLSVTKHKPTSAPTPSSPPHQPSLRKPLDKQRNLPERSPQARNRYLFLILPYYKLFDLLHLNMAGTGLLRPVHVPDLHPKFAQQPKTTTRLPLQKPTEGLVLLLDHRVPVNGNRRHILTIMEDQDGRQIEDGEILRREKSYGE